METIQLTLDESLLAEVQQVANALEMTLSEFTKLAVERALRQTEIIARERRDAQGYSDHRQQPEKIEEL